MAEAKYSRYFTYIKPATENKYVKSSAPYVFSLLAITVLTVFAIRPTVSTILNLQKNLENNQQVLSSLNSKAETLAAAKRNYENLSPEVKTKINDAIPDQANVTSIIGSLKTASSNISSSSALQIQPVTIIDTTIPANKTKSTLGEVSFSYNVEGSYAQFIAILKNLSKTPRLINIDSIIIGKQSEDKTTIMSINGNAYYLK